MRARSASAITLAVRPSGPGAAPPPDTSSGARSTRRPRARAAFASSHFQWYKLRICPSIRCGSRQRGIKLDGAPRRRFRLRNGFARRQRTAEQKLQLRLGQRRMRFRKVRLPGDRLLEIPDRGAEAVIALQAVCRHALEIQVVRHGIDNAPGAGAARLRDRLTTGRRRDLGGDPLLEREDAR